eukprot:s6264_g3.t1
MLTYHLQGGMGSRLRATSITGMLGCLAVNAAVAWTCFRKSPNTEQKVRVHGPVASLETCLLRACFACSCLQFFEETPVEQRMVRATSTPDGSAAENVEFLAESPHQADICTEAIPRRAPVTSQRALPRPGGHRRATDKQRFRVCLLRRAGALQRNAGGHLGVNPFCSGLAAARDTRFNGSAAGSSLPPDSAILLQQEGGSSGPSLLKFSRYAWPSHAREADAELAIGAASSGSNPAGTPTAKNLLCFKALVHYCYRFGSLLGEPGWTIALRAFNCLERTFQKAAPVPGSDLSLYASMPLCKILLHLFIRGLLSSRAAPCFWVLGTSTLADAGCCTFMETDKQGGLFLWDAVCITARVPSHAEAYRRELQRRGPAVLTSLLLAVSDPEQPEPSESTPREARPCSIGSGGATLNALLLIAEHLSALQGESSVDLTVLRDRRVLILHVGGTEQRIPAFSLLPNFQEGMRSSTHALSTVDLLMDPVEEAIRKIFGDAVDDYPDSRGQTYWQEDSNG